jgi:hypothetical protein
MYLKMYEICYSDFLSCHPVQSSVYHHFVQYHVFHNYGIKYPYVNIQSVHHQCKYTIVRTV